MSGSSLLRTKMLLLAILPVVFCAGYFSLQHVSFFAARTLPLTAIDRAVPFRPQWIYAYQSLYLLMPIPPLLATRKKQLDRYARGFLGLTAAAFVVFAVFPIVSPRPVGATGVAAFDLLTSVEGKLNAFPSLHAGLLAYTLCFASWTLRDEVTPVMGWILTLLGLVWGAAILYATLATKQHYALDLPAGLALGCLSYLCSGFTVHNKARHNARAQ